MGIRDVPTDHISVPVLFERMRFDTNAMFTQVSKDTDVSKSTLPNIIDVPRWLARIEPQIAVLNDAAAENGE